MIRRLTWTTALLLLLLTACVSKIVPPPRNADYYFKQGEGLYDKGLYEQAIKSWERVRDSYYSPALTALAQRKIADAHYQAGQYVEAAAAYEDFLKQHPESKDTPTILFQLGMSYFQQILSPDRDQTATRSALATFENLLKRFPNYPKNELARIRIRHCRNTLADHQFLIGKFYLDYGHPKAALPRLEAIFSRYPNFLDRDKVYFYLGKAYLETGQREKAVTAFNTLFKDFPNSEYILRGQKLLEKRF